MDNFVTGFWFSFQLFLFSEGYFLRKISNAYYSLIKKKKQHTCSYHLPQIFAVPQCSALTSGTSVHVVMSASDLPKGGEKQFYFTFNGIPIIWQLPTNLHGLSIHRLAVKNWKEGQFQLCCSLSVPLRYLFMVFIALTCFQHIENIKALFI